MFWGYSILRLTVIFGIVSSTSNQQLVSIKNEATATTDQILKIYGETNASSFALDDLDSARDRAKAYYGRLGTLLERISEA